MTEANLVPLLLTKEQAALLLGVCTRTVERLVAAEKLHAVPIGNKIAKGKARPGRPGWLARVRLKRREVLKLAETGWTW